jgi:hypothetical protein
MNVHEVEYVEQMPKRALRLGRTSILCIVLFGIQLSDVYGTLGVRLSFAESRSLVKYCYIVNDYLKVDINLLRR